MNKGVVLFNITSLHEVHVCSIHQAVVDITSKRVVIQSIERDLVLRIFVVVFYTERGRDTVRFRSYIPNWGKPPTEWGGWSVIRIIGVLSIPLLALLAILEIRVTTRKESTNPIIVHFPKGVVQIRLHRYVNSCAQLVFHSKVTLVVLLFRSYHLFAHVLLTLGHMCFIFVSKTNQDWRTTGCRKYSCEDHLVFLPYTCYRLSKLHALLFASDNHLVPAWTCSLGYTQLLC